VTRTLHCADLHLSVTERDYSLSVLSEIVRIAKEKNADVLLFAGDTFDSFPDVEKLRGDFKERVDQVGDSVTVLLLPGNHEDLQRGQQKLSSFDLGRARLLDKEPYDILSFPDMELLSIPAKKSYDDYREWRIAPKKMKFRIATAHCVVAGLGIPFIEDEEMDSVIDPDLFQLAEVDYAALGHIHSGRVISLKSTLPGGPVRTLSYPGSARVYRRGETGPRTVTLIEVGNEIHATSLVLKSAGQYREVFLDVGLDGALPDISHLSKEWDESDRVELFISGIVEDENALTREAEALAQSLAVRVANSVPAVSVLAGISSQPIARKFLELSDKARPAARTPEFAVWHKTREIGLLKIKKVLEARS
jgi:DNA repair exonuclease SbcCD nuclease subunit